MGKFFVFLITILFLSVGLILLRPKQTAPAIVDDGGEMEEELHPLSVAALRQGEYPGSEITIEQTLDPGTNYSRQIVSYRSEGLKIYALMTIPGGDRPKNGWPAVIFNHGYIPPTEYRTTERYLSYVDSFARNGYVVFKSDYRGHGNSEGEPGGAYGSPNYTIDVLNALSSVARYPDVDPDRIGMWGHSMGGYITLRSMVVDRNIRAGVVWAGVVASYPDLINRWRRRPSTIPTLPGGRGYWRIELIEKYGTPEENPEFWNSISANSFLNDISGPLQLHHGTADYSVPVEFSETLVRQLNQAGRPVEYYSYPDDDHNISANFNTAMDRSVAFFDKHVKGK